MRTRPSWPAPRGKAPTSSSVHMTGWANWRRAACWRRLDLGDKKQDFAPAALDAFTYNGELYGVPNAVENVALLRNKDLVPDAPKTWDEVAEISKKLAANNKPGSDANVYGFVREEGNPYTFFPIQTAYGGYVFGRTADGNWNPKDVGLDDAGSIAAVNWYAQTIADGLQPKGMASDTLQTWFDQGKVGMVISGPWDLPRLADSKINYE